MKMIKPQTHNFDDIKTEFPIFNDTKLVFLDSAASAQKPNAVINSINDVYSNHYANIHRGLYTLSQIATDKHEDAREIVKEFITTFGFCALAALSKKTNLVSLKIGNSVFIS